MGEFVAKNWFGIGVLILQAIIFMVFKFNDLKHLADDFKEFKDAVWNRVDEQGKELKACGKCIARIEGHLGVKMSDTEE